MYVQTLISKALARAIYSKREVSIIDDILSGLDWVTEEAVWENVFGQRGLFRQQGVTVVLATHKGWSNRSNYSDVN